VAAAAVVAKPDDKWGETPCAFVELKPGADLISLRANKAGPFAVHTKDLPGRILLSSLHP
jgi:acyl-CoA synthetase (AMP-forming)/AMP-acid ligase II